MFLTRRFYVFATLLILLIASGYLWLPLFTLGQWLSGLFLLAVAVEVFLLYNRQGIHASRQCADRFSNGDDNMVRIRVESSYSFPVRAEVIDEVPVVFQWRDVLFRVRLRSQVQVITYRLRPVTRGVYSFGHVRVFASTRLGLVQRRFTCAAPQDVKVYPSYLMLHQYEFLAIHNHLTETGIKRIRRIGHHTEFEQIRDYVAGDDFRTINWRATARRHQLMVNDYQDERSQQIFSVIDKGRVMQQAFTSSAAPHNASASMTLLDYAINASLVLSYVAVSKDDKAGLITFSDTFGTFVPAARQSGQMQLLLESLYAQQTQFGETDFSALCTHVNKLVGKRSLLVLYTNFTGMVSLRRQLPYLQQLNRRHRLLVVFFEDVELRQLAEAPAKTEEEKYHQAIAEKFAYEKHLIVATLKQHGISALLTAPESLSVNVVNRYLEMKQQGFVL